MRSYIKASNAAKQKLIGSNVSLSGNTLAVEVHGENSNATGVNGESSSATTVNGNQADNIASYSGAIYIY